ncbi:ABC transporter permease [Arthrobacter sp. 7749]|nr:ABC transporter permease [Arthrobacter sp. 7749]
MSVLSANVAQAEAPGVQVEHPWRVLCLQLLGILAALAVLMIWVLNADLSETERTTLDPATLWGYTIEHVSLTMMAAVIVLIIAIPLGILLTRPSLRRLSTPVMAIANIGQAAPAIGLVVILAFWLGFGYWAAVIALVLYAILPVLTNTMVGLRQVDERLVEAGRGMGMSSMAVLLKVELPLAVPVMLSGIRTALVLLVGTATLATFINGGGLGILINTGVNLNLTAVLVAGSLLVALLALLIDWLGRVVEQLARPKGL